MRVVIASAFRNAAGRQVARWLEQVCALRDALYQDASTYLRAVAVEGDSTDATRTQLQCGAAAAGLDFHLLTCNHGGPVYPSVEDPARLAALSRVGNAILSSVRETDDILIYVESDLIWTPDTMITLIATVLRGESDVIAPLVFAGELFYDVFLYRRNGIRFSPFAPYHPDLNGMPLLVDSVGSCLVMRADVARQCRMIDNALLDFCQDVRSKGYAIKVDPSQRVEHPA